MNNAINFEEFIHGYCRAASLKQKFKYKISVKSNISHTSNGFLRQARADCQSFINEAIPMLGGIASERAGYLFWMSRNRYPYGFWDDYSIDADQRHELDKLARTFPEHTGASREPI